MNQVTIGKEFFKKSLNDYEDWQFAWVRESMQNSIDCGSSEIKFWHDYKSIRTENNGPYMTDEILLGKLMSLGSSGKDFANSVGGFGRAKEILLFAHDRYEIHTGNLLLRGSGGDYTIEETEFFAGTKMHIWFDDDFDPESHLRDLCSFLTYSGQVFYNDEEIKERMPELRQIGTYDWGKVFVTEGSYRAIVRIGGLKMFETFIFSEKNSFVVDLEGKSSDALTSNRDGLKSHVDSDLRILIQKLAFEAEDNFETATPHWIVYGTPESEAQTTQEEQELPEYSLEEAEAQAAIFESEIKEYLKPKTPLKPEDSAALVKAIGVKAENEVPQWEKKEALLFPYYIKNNLKYKIPSYFLQEQISSYGIWLLKTWEAALVGIYEALGKSEKFGIGFIMSQKAEALCEKNGGNLIYLLNPVVVEKNGIKLRYLKSDVSRIKALAAHEVAHGYYKDFNHGEKYASNLTDIIERLFSKSEI